MAQSREVEMKEGFFNHGTNFFKGRMIRSNDLEARRRIATDADPYGHVENGKPSRAARTRSLDLNGDGSAEAEDFVIVAPTVDSDDPFAEVYAMLREHGGVRFGAQRADGSWEVAALVRRPAAQDEPQRTALDSATQDLLQQELQRFAAARKS